MATVDDTRVRGGRSSLRSARLREAGVGYAFVARRSRSSALFFIFPIVYAVYISFFHWGILGKQAGAGTATTGEVLARPVSSTGAQEHRRVHRGVVPARDGARPRRWR